MRVKKHVTGICAVVCMSLMIGCAPKKPTEQRVPILPEVPIALPKVEIRNGDHELASVKRVDLENPTADRGQLEDWVDSTRRFSLDVRNATLDQALKMIAPYVGRPIVADSGTSANVSMRLDQGTALTAVRSLIDQASLGWRMEGETLRIGQVPLATTAFHLVLPDAILLKSIDELVGRENQALTWPAIQNAVELVLSKEGSAQIDPFGSIVWVQDRPDRIGVIERVLRQVVEPRRRQVVLEALILEVELDDTLNYGIDWSVADIAFKLGGTRVISEVGATLAPSSGVASIGLDSNKVSSFLSALKSNGHLQVLSSPRMTAMNRVTATMSVTEEIPFFTADFAGIGNDVVQAVEVEFRQAGVKLDITPLISSSGEVMLDIRPLITELTGFTPALQGLPPNPIIDTREVRSLVRAQDGESIVVAGLIRRRFNEGTRGIPGLGSVPGAGWAFRSLDQNAVRSELVIILTPRVSTDELQRNLVEDGLERLEDVGRPFRHGPAYRNNTEGIR